MLRIAGQEERVEEWLRPIPFPRHRVEKTDRGMDSIEMAEQALDLMQDDLDEMNRLLDRCPSRLAPMSMMVHRSPDRRHT